MGAWNIFPHSALLLKGNGQLIEFPIPFAQLEAMFPAQHAPEHSFGLRVYDFRGRSYYQENICTARHVDYTLLVLYKVKPRSKAKPVDKEYPPPFNIEE